MKKDTLILLAEDDPGHAALARMSLRRVGIHNRVIQLEDGQKTLDFLFGRGEGASRDPEADYLLLLDLRMPKVDGISILRQIKRDEQLRTLPVVVLSTTDNPEEIQACYNLHCSHYIVKPAGYGEFVEAMRQLEPFLESPQVTATTGQGE